MSEIGDFKRKVIAKLEAQKHTIDDAEPLVEQGWKTRENSAYDKAIKIVESA